MYVSAIPLARERQNRKIFVSLIEKITDALNITLDDLMK